MRSLLHRGGYPHEPTGLYGYQFRPDKPTNHWTLVTTCTLAPPYCCTDRPISPLLPPPAMKGAMAVHPDTSDEGAKRHTNVMT